MLPQFLNHIDQAQLILPNQRVLLAVSGGIDSMVMLELFRQSPFEFAVAHCNFQLRGADSEGDASFVESLCRQYQIPFFSKRFETNRYAEEQGVSVQMAARELRYQWFDELLRIHQLDLIATAHHLNDTLETVLLNLIRGTGLDGLTGIPERNGNIIRPLLYFSKATIETYAQQNSLTWREDISNQTDHYDRNFIRHQVVPLLSKVNPALEDGFKISLERLQGAKALAADQISNLKKQLVDPGGIISIEGIASTSSPAVVLWYFIRDKGFTFDQCKKIIVSHETGTSFYSENFRLTIDRGAYLLTEVNKTKMEPVSIHAGLGMVKMGAQQLLLERLNEISGIEKSAEIAMLDAEVLTFPLRWRKWEPGDQFIPLGMDQHKKISDFLIDEKVPLPLKEHVTVLESAGKICWVVGYRISNPFKITSSTREAIIIRNIR